MSENKNQCEQQKFCQANGSQSECEEYDQCDVCICRICNLSTCKPSVERKIKNKTTIKYSFENSYDCGASAKGTDTYPNEESFIRAYPHFECLFSKFQNFQKLKLEIQGFEYKQTIEVERQK